MAALPSWPGQDGLGIVARPPPEVVLGDPFHHEHVEVDLRDHQVVDGAGRGRPVTPALSVAPPTVGVSCAPAASAGWRPRWR